MNKWTDNINKSLLEGIKLLDEIEVPFFLTSGILLGLTRDGKLIDWDYDIDVDVLEEDLTPEKREILINSKYMKSANLYKGGVGHYSKRQYDARFDIFVLYRKNGKLFRNPCGDTCMWFPEELYENPGEIEYLDRKFLIPNPVEDWLVHFYGKDWRTPVKIWSWMQDCKNRCTLEEV